MYQKRVTVVLIVEEQYLKTQEKIIKQGKLSNFDEFLTENRKAINKQFAVVFAHSEE